MNLPYVEKAVRSALLALSFRPTQLPLSRSRDDPMKHATGATPGDLHNVRDEEIDLVAEQFARESRDFRKEFGEWFDSSGVLRRSTYNDVEDFMEYVMAEFVKYWRERDADPLDRPLIE